MPRFVLALAALAPLAGCAGSIQTDEVDGFGTVASAVWLFNDDSNTHQIVLTNVVGACGKFQAYYEAYDEFEDAAADLGLDDLDDYCEEMEEPSKNLATSADALYHEGAHYLTLTLSDGGDTEPDDEEYEVGDDPGVYGALTYIENSPYAAVLQDYDPDAEDWLCGVDEDDVEQDQDSWALDDGALEVTAVNDEANVSGRFEGELADDGGDDAGNITFSFTATYCEVG